MRTRLMIVLAVMLMLTAGQALAANLVSNGSFEVGPAGWQHWWSPSEWNNFTVIEGEYFHQTTPAGLPTIGGIMQWEYMEPWTPTRTATYLEDGMNAWVDTSAGYGNPIAAGARFMKKKPGGNSDDPTNKFWSGIDQTLTGLTVGQKYLVTAWGANNLVASDDNEGGTTAADMRILVDTNGGVDARTASISSIALPVRQGGRYWLWSSIEGNDRLGNFADLGADDVTGYYMIDDSTSVRFTATGASATIFLLADTSNWDGRRVGITWDNVSVTAIPEPSSLVALGMPLLLGGLSLVRRRKS